MLGPCGFYCCRCCGNNGGRLQDLSRVLETVIFCLCSSYLPECSEEDRVSIIKQGKDICTSSKISSQNTRGHNLQFIEHDQGRQEVACSQSLVPRVSDAVSDRVQSDRTVSPELVTAAISEDKLARPVIYLKQWNTMSLVLHNLQSISCRKHRCIKGVVP